MKIDSFFVKTIFGDYMSNDDYLLSFDLNSSLKRSLISVNTYIKYKKESSENLEFQKKIYSKYIFLSNSLLNGKINNVTWFEKSLIIIKYFICSFFRLDAYFYDSFLEKDISWNMRRVILSEGNYNKASNDIRLLTKYYLSIETRLILELHKKKPN